MKTPNWKTSTVATALLFVLSGSLGALVDEGIKIEKESMPNLERKVEPIYPYELRQKCIEGTVTLSAVINDNGKLTDITIEKADLPAFNKAAVRALKKWRFKPFKVEGADMPRITIPIRFAMNPESEKS